MFWSTVVLSMATMITVLSGQVKKEISGVELWF